MMLTPRVILLVAAAVSAVLAGCPSSDWMRYGEKCYWSSGINVQWKDAKSACQSLFPHSDLVSIHDLGLDAFISEWLLGGTEAWLGLSCTDCSSDPPQGCTWTDGSPYDYTNWYGGSANASGECCAFINYGNDGDWTGDGCADDTLYFMCQISAS